MITRLETYLNEGSKRNIYDVCIFKAENSDEYKMIQKVLFEKGYIWNNTSDNNYITFDVFPQVIWCWTNTDNLTTSTMRVYDEQRIIDYITEENLKYENDRHICPIIFKANDVHYLNTILKYGNITPEYKPRKISRTLEGVNYDFDNKYQYDIIVIHIDNMEDMIRIQKLMFKYNIYWGGGTQSIVDINTYLNLDLCIFLSGIPSENKAPCILFGSLNNIKEYYKDFKTENNIYTIEDYKKIENILRYGSKIGVPSYKPRRIERTLESINYNDKYNCIIIEFKNEDEVTIFKNIILNFCKRFNLPTSNIEHHFSVVNYNSMNYYSRIFKDSDNNLVVKGGFVEDLNQVSKDRGFNFDKVHYVNELIRFLNDFFNITPSYKPRKIKRTLESNVFDNKHYIASKFNKNPYDVVIYRYVYNRENFLKFINFLNKYTLFDSNFDNYEFSNFEDRDYFFTLKNNNQWEQFMVYSAQYDETDNINFPIDWPNLKVYPNIVNSVEELDDVIKEAMMGGDAPSYEPKIFSKNI